MLPSEISKLLTDPPVRGFLLFGNFSSFTTPSPVWVSVPNTFLSPIVFYILSYFLSKRMGCLSGCLESSASIQKFFFFLFLFFFVEVAQHSDELLMNLWERKWSPCPIPLPSWASLYTLNSVSPQSLYDSLLSWQTFNSASDFI